MYDSKKYINQFISNSGYYMVSLLDNNKNTHMHLVHRLVIISFNPFKRIEANQVNHKDSNKLNNDITNLEWMTPYENTRHAMENGNFKFCEDRYNAIFTNNQIHMICKMLENNYSYSDILKKLNMDINDNTINYIGNIKRGITYKSISNMYDFSDYKCTFSKYNKNQLNFIYECVNNNMTYREIANLMGIDISTRKQQKAFSDIVLRIRKKESFKNIINYENEGSTTIESII